MQQPRLLDFDNKLAVFRSRLQAYREASETGMGGIHVEIRRSHIFEDSFHQFRGYNVDELHQRLTVHFTGEEGIDAGGVSREWYQVISREMFNPNYALFIATDDGAFHPNPFSRVNPDHLDYFKFIGRVVGKALWDGVPLDAHFTRPFYKHILGLEVTFRDLESVDNGYHRTLNWLLEKDATEIGAELTFTVLRDQYGKKQTVELKPGGSQICVTNDNKHEYVKLLVEERLTTSTREQTASFLAGFREMVPKELLSPLFNEHELELLISGLPEVDIDDLKANTEYRGYEAGSDQIRWFWQAVNEFSQEERALLVQFVTGSSKVPLEGFAALKGMSGPSKFTITRTYHSTGLPTAHTCFNQIDLPEYTSYETLRRNLRLAVKEGCEGFGFG